MTDFQKYGRLGKPLRMLIIGQTGSGKTHQLIRGLDNRMKRFGRKSFFVVLISQSARNDKTWEQWGGVDKYVDMVFDNYDEDLQNTLPNLLTRANKRHKRPIIIFDDKGYEQSANSSSSGNYVRYIATAANQNRTDLIMLHQRPQYIMGDLVSNAQIVMLMSMDPRADRNLAVEKFLGRFEKKRALAILDQNVRQKHDYLLIDDTGDVRVFYNAHGEVDVPEHTASLAITQQLSRGQLFHYLAFIRTFKLNPTLITEKIYSEIRYGLIIKRSLTIGEQLFCCAGCNQVFSRVLQFDERGISQYTTEADEHDRNNNIFSYPSMGQKCNECERYKHYFVNDPRMPSKHPPEQATSGQSVAATTAMEDQRRTNLFARDQDRSSSKRIGDAHNERKQSIMQKAPINTILNIAHSEIAGGLVPTEEWNSFNNRPLANGSFLINQPASSNQHGVQLLLGSMARVERPFDMLDPHAEYQQAFPDIPVPKTITYLPQAIHTPLQPGQTVQTNSGYIYGTQRGVPISITDQVVASNQPPPDQQGKPGIAFPLNN
jgi:hypothetical protein